jgi:hypothetical protein
MAAEAMAVTALTAIVTKVHIALVLEEIRSRSFGFPLVIIPPMCPLLLYNSCSYRIQRRFNRPLMQHRKEPALVASLDWRRPRIGSRGRRMAR